MSTEERIVTSSKDIDLESNHSKLCSICIDQNSKDNYIKLECEH